MMRYLRTCIYCGRVHDDSFKCNFKPKKNWNKYKTETDKLRNKKAWARLAERVKKDSNYLCQVCFDKGRFVYNGLEAHHIIKISDNPDKLLDENNVVCLCRYCHRQADRGELATEYLRELAKKRIDKTK